MKKENSYLFIQQADINEGLTTGTITKASLLMTADYIFVLPTDPDEIHYVTVNTESKPNYIDSILSKSEVLSKDELETELIDTLDYDYVFPVDKLDKLSVQVGFWIFGGMQMKRKGDYLKSVNIQSKATRQEIKNFYKI